MVTWKFKDKNKALKTHNKYISVIRLLNVFLTTGNKLDSNFSHVDEGFEVVAKIEAPWETIICSIVLSTRYTYLFPNGIETSVIIVDRG